MRIRLQSMLVGLFALTAIPSPGLAQSRAPDLSQVSIEDLMRIEITSAARKEQRAADVAAAVFVISQDDIRRSGLRTVPELLRLVPGAQVAQINADKWAISIRGFSQLYANKLLVLVDGRSVYNRSFSGVYWESIDLLLDDVDRIEVVRGPGAATWGANAVNGVINIVTKTAAETQGGLVRLGLGTLDGSQVSARYGGAFGDTVYRVFSQWSDHGDTALDARKPAGDNWSSLSNGLRLDWGHGANAITLDAGFVTNQTHSLWLLLAGPTAWVPINDGSSSHFKGGSVLGRWTHVRASGSTWQVQSSADIRHRTQAGIPAREATLDVDAQYHVKAGARHDVVTGAAYRFVHTQSDGAFTYSLNPEASDNVVASAFIEDEIAIGRRVRVALGSRVEHDTIAGWGFAPSGRVMWSVSQRQRLWAALSRARRTPSVSDLNIRINYAAFMGPQGVPVVLGVLGNPAATSEKFISADLGYRLQIGDRASLDVAAFRGHYDDLQTNEPSTPVIELTPGPPHLFVATQFGNLLQVDTTGVEIVAQWMPDRRWRVEGSLSTLRLVPHRRATSQDEEKDRFDGNAPTYSARFRSTVALGSRTELTAALFHVGALRDLGVPSYTRADVRLERTLTTRLSIVAGGQNLFDPSHAEHLGRSGLTATRVPRSASVQLLWRSR